MTAASLEQLRDLQEENRVLRERAERAEALVGRLDDLVKNAEQSLAECPWKDWSDHKVRQFLAGLRDILASPATQRLAEQWRAPLEEAIQREFYAWNTSGAPQLDAMSFLRRLIVLCVAAVERALQP